MTARLATPRPSFIAGLCACFWVASAQAEAPQLPAPLPDLQAGAGVLVDADHSDLFRELLPPELYSYLRSGDLIFEAGKNLPSIKPPDSSWSEGSRQLQNRNVDPSRLEAVGTVPAGFRFGPGDAVDLSDPDIAGHKILWNTFDFLWSLQLFRVEFSMLSVKERKTARRFRLLVDRAYSPLAPQGKIPQAFRERIRFMAPQVLGNLAWLTFRFIGNEEDALWAFAPSIGKTRQLTGSNRGDAIFMEAPAPDDLFVWSGKPELTEVGSVKEEVRLVPFSRRPSLTAVASEGDPCVVVPPIEDKGVRRPLLTDWNFGSGKYPKAAEWIPTDAVWVARNVFRLEVSSKDPFYASGREVMYVDRDLMVPVYRMTYSSRGELEKIILGVPVQVVLPVNKTSSRTITFPGATASINVAQRHVTMLGLSAFVACSQFSEALSVRHFDPSNLAPPVPTASPTQKPGKAIAAPKAVPASTPEAPSDD